MPELAQQKCACADCVCIFNINDALKKDDRNSCSDDCANGHQSGSGCGHTGCACDG